MSGSKTTPAAKKENLPTVSEQTSKRGWRSQCAAIVEELFAATPKETWDALLDLRQSLLLSKDWEGMIRSFLVCRHLLERDHYLPFYRLRRLLAGSLELEVIWSDAPDGQIQSLAQLLRDPLAATHTPIHDWLAQDDQSPVTNRLSAPIPRRPRRRPITYRIIERLA